MKREWLLLALMTAAVATALALQSPSEGQKEQAAKKTTSKSAHVFQPRSAAVFLRALEIKNVPELKIKVFEFNTETYYK